jgi:cold shock CspA family protein
MTSISETSTSVTESEKFIGCVKWFNNKEGYGFITIKEGIKSGTDIFVHHSSINVENQQYKYLVQGEYVEFKLATMENSKHQCQASHVSGINSGKLMCETRREFKISRTNYKTVTVDRNTSQPTVEGVPQVVEVSEEKVKIPRQSRPSRVRGDGPRGDIARGESQKSEWTDVKKPRKPYTKKETSVKAV